MDAGQIVITIVSALLLLTALIVVHELGHYWVAKKRGIKVAEFAVGFGPRLIKWHRGETEFSIRPFFIGGFVKFADDMEEDAPPKPGDFRTASLKSRVLTVIAGPAMNVLFAFVIAVIALMIYGNGSMYVKVGEVTPGTPAYEAGLAEGDIIKEINGVAIDTETAQADIQEYAAQEQGSSLPITVERDGTEVSLTIPYMDELSEAGRKITGFQLEYDLIGCNFFEAVGYGFQWLFNMMGEMLSTLGRLFFMGQGVENVAGIVGTAVIVGQAVSYGAYSVMVLMAMISLNLAIVNLLPIPALDGGKLILYAVEGVRKKPTPEKVEGILNLVGMAAIMCLAGFLVFQDISRLVI